MNNQKIKAMSQHGPKEAMPSIPHTMAATDGSPPAGRSPAGRPPPAGSPALPPCFYAWQLAPKPYLCAKYSVRAHTHGQRDPPVDSHKAWTVWCISQTPIVRFGCVFVLAFSFLQPSSCSELRAYSSEQLGIVALLAPMYQCLGPVHWKGCGS